MSVGRLQRIGISVALGSCVALGCGGEKSEEPAGAKSEAPGGAESEANAQAQPEEPAGAQPEAAAGAAAATMPEAPTTLPDFDTLPSVELPEDFPEDVPLYPGTRAVKATPDPESEGSWVAQFSASDDPATIYADLANTFAALGWSTERADAPDGILLYASKGDRNVTYAMSTTEEGKTVVTLLIIAEQP